MSTISNTQTTEGLKLPEFTLSDPKLWFDAVEEIFSIAETSDEEKSDHVRAQLSNPHFEWLFADYMPDESGLEYSELREYVLSRLCQEQRECIDLIALFECGDLKPSTFLSHLICVTTDVIPNSLIRTIWLARLPRRIQKILFIAMLLDPEPIEDRSVHSLAAVADGVAAYEKYFSFPTIKLKQIPDLPDYDGSDPELWFHFLDEAFSANDITNEELKYEYAVKAMLSQELYTASLFLTDLPNETTEKQYFHLRERIITTFTAIQENKINRFVFRDMSFMKPSQSFQFLNELAAKCGRVVPQVLVRTLWIMQLPIETQAVLFHLMSYSADSLQDINMKVLSSVADTASDSNKMDTMKKLIGYLSGPSLEDKEIDMEIFQTEMQRACSLQQKIALGRRYCDYMYKIYYENSPSKSVDSCTTYNQDYTVKELYDLGCTCWYHQTYKENSFKCLQLLYN